jgi:hypothetical protein
MIKKMKEITKLRKTKPESEIPRAKPQIRLRKSKMRHPKLRKPNIGNAADSVLGLWSSRSVTMNTAEEFKTSIVTIDNSPAIKNEEIPPPLSPISQQFLQRSTTEPALRGDIRNNQTTSFKYEPRRNSAQLPSTTETVNYAQSLSGSERLVLPTEGGKQEPVASKIPTFANRPLNRHTVTKKDVWVQAAAPLAVPLSKRDVLTSTKPGKAATYPAAMGKEALGITETSTSLLKANSDHHTGTTNRSTSKLQKYGAAEIWCCQKEENRFVFWSRSGP